MIVTCPNCSTKFNLPETQAAPGAKLRCSVCKHVFQLSEGVKPTEIRMEPELNFSAPLNMPLRLSGSEQAFPRNCPQRGPFHHECAIRYR